MAETREGETERGRTESERGEGASETGKVDEREKERGKLRESGEEKTAIGKECKKREDSSANQPSSIPLTADFQAGRGSLAHQEKKKTRNCIKKQIFSE